MRGTSPARYLRVPLRVVAAVLAAGLLAACGLLVDRPLPAPDCSETRFDPPAALSCEAAVAAAVDSVSSSSPITALSFQYGSLCPPNARCLPPGGSTGTVIITFADASQVSVFVSIDGGQLLVEAAQDYPRPGWER